MHVTLYEVSSESQFSDSVWWFYEPAQNEKIQTTLYITFCTLHGSGLYVLYSVMLGKKLDKIEILARTQGLKRDTNKRMSVV